LRNSHFIRAFISAPRSQDRADVYLAVESGTRAGMTLRTRLRTPTLIDRADAINLQDRPLRIRQSHARPEDGGSQTAYQSGRQNKDGRAGQHTH
jgi:hypothetical protein